MKTRQAQFIEGNHLTGIIFIVTQLSEPAYKFLKVESRSLDVVEKIAHFVAPNRSPGS
ncbi:uncharacterized protein TrAtP1_007786 [Trichoderma atroviride]|uniref:uncharacterized protein n=1 Tax=Hypocrea atroviridis TaxID=63577 RepID=UPI003327CDCF|nr:hypothetical protein TrAtP1_007786 [Trichoderma atroviride]